MDEEKDGAWHDRMYNNRALVPQYGEHLKRWADDSAQARAGQRCKLDVSYGRGPNEKLDIFHARRADAPVLVFLHGGYWRSLDKSDHSFIAPAFTREACVVVPNYALCPAVTVPQIVMQMVKALAWTWKNIARYGGDPSRITVVGHSAGGHLAAMVLACLWPVVDKTLPAALVRNAMSISGLHDLAPILRTPFLQQDLHLTDRQVGQASPCQLPAPAAGALYAVCGGDESPEFLRQNALIRETWGAARVPVCGSVKGLNHFSVLDALVQPSHRVHVLAQELLRRG